VHNVFPFHKLNAQKIRKQKRYWGRFANMPLGGGNMKNFAATKWGKRRMKVKD
jgi:hypothetical protein